MSRTFKTADYDVALDLTVRLGDCFPPDHLTCFGVDIIAQLDLSSMYARYSTRGGQPYALEILLAVLAVEFANGAHGMIHVSAVAHTGDRDGEQHVILHGETGTLEVAVSFEGADAGATIKGSRHGEKHFHTLPTPADLWGAADRTQPFVDQIGDLFVKQPIGARLFVDAILEDRPVEPNFYDGLKAQEVVDAALESHRSGRWVSVSGLSSTQSSFEF